MLRSSLSRACGLLCNRSTASPRVWPALSTADLLRTQATLEDSRVSCGGRAFSATTDGRSTRSASVLPEDHYDVVVVGGGMVGAAFACGLAANPLTAALRVAVVDHLPMPPPPPPPPAEIGSAAVPDPRVSSLTPATVRFLEAAGVWEQIKGTPSTAPFVLMQVWESGGQGYVRYKATDVGESALGFVAENRVIVRALQERLQESGAADLISSSEVEAVTWTEERVGASQGQGGGGVAAGGGGASGGGTGGAAQVAESWTRVRLKGKERELRARLVVGADGARSRVRDFAGIQVATWPYDQNALVATVEVDAPHATAWQRFLPTGPLALLPMGGRFSNIVWSTTKEEAERLSSLSEAEFVGAVNRALMVDFAPAPLAAGWSQVVPGNTAIDLFQAPPTVVGAPGPRPHFPLRLLHARQYVAARLALVGDAAHSVHPLAGQGVNLGFGDAEDLVAVLAKGVRSGRDIGELSLLEEYQWTRRKANLPMMAALHGIQKVFAFDWGPFESARNFGLEAINCLPPLKANIVSFAASNGFSLKDIAKRWGVPLSASS